jgi:biopolymer transport protein ExbB/TolQ
MFGTLLGIVYSFPPLGAERWTAYFATMKLLSQSLVPAEFGLLVALFTYCGCKYLHGRLDDFDREMECASLQLINQLGTTNP